MMNQFQQKKQNTPENRRTGLARNHNSQFEGSNIYQTGQISTDINPVDR